MPLNDYQLGGTIVIKGAKRASRALGGVYKMSKKVFRALGKVAVMAGRTVRAAFRKMRGALLGGTVAAVAALKVWGDFTLQMAKVGTLLDDGRKSMGQYGDAVRRMAIETGQGTAVVSDGFFQAISAGVDAGNAIEFMGVASQAAVGGFTSMNTAVDGLTNVINAYGLSSDKAREISDAFFTANKFGKTTFDELSRSIGIVAPTAAALGSSYEDLLASTISITKAGVTTRQTMTQLSSIMTSTLNATPELSKAAREQLGLTFGPDAIKHYGGIIPFMEAVQEKTGGNLAVLKKLFPSVEALRGVLRLTSRTGLAEANAGLEQINKNAGITKEKFDEVSETFGHQLKQIMAGSAEVLRSVGQAMVEGFGIDLGSVVKMMKTRIPEMRRRATQFFAGIRDGFREVMPGVKAAWGEALQSMGAAGRELFKQLTGGFGDSNSAAGAWGKAVGRIVGKAVEDFGRLTTAVSDLTKKFGEHLQSIVDTVKGLGAAGQAVMKFFGFDPGGPSNRADAAQARAGAGVFNRNEVARKEIAARFGNVPNIDALSEKLAGGRLTGFDLFRLRPETGKVGLGGVNADELAKSLGDRIASRERRHETIMMRRRDRQQQIDASPASTSGFPGLPPVSREGAQLLQEVDTMLRGTELRPYNVNVEIEQRNEFNVGGSKSKKTKHTERGAGDATARISMLDRYLITEGEISSVPLEFVQVHGAGSSVFAGSR